MKKKALSKMAAVILAVSTVLCACGNESRGQAEAEKEEQADQTVAEESKEPAVDEPYTIVYAFDVWVQQADWDLVEENLSNIVEEKIGAKVELLPMTGANYQQQINLMISSGEKLDLYNASARTTFSSDITSNKIMGLDEEMIRQYAPDALKEEGEFINATTIGGKIYGFPTIRDMANAYGLIIRNDMAEKYGVDVESGMTIDDLDDLFARVSHEQADQGKGSCTVTGT